MFELRPYQKAATDAAKTFLKASIEPCLIDAAPAAGKSFCVAEMARWFREVSGGKRVLCLQPSSALVKQNVEKFRMTGEKCSIFSASAGSKSTRHSVVYATPKTVSNSMSRFKKTGPDGYCAVIIDESHGLTPTIRAVIEQMREVNPNLRAIGLTGSPYRMGKGYIFRMWPDGKCNGDDVARDPYFTKMVYRVTAEEMLEQGFITPMVVRPINDESIYDTSGVILKPNGSLDHSTLEAAFEGHGRKTAMIVYDVMAQVASLGCTGGIMLFAATQKHALEIMASLPPQSSAVCTGDHQILNGKTSNENQIIEAYRKQQTRYLVSVGKFNVGFDVSHTEFLALMRYSESPDLTIQTLGRAWRLHPGKHKAYIADYAGNLDRHMPDGDLYNPSIKAGKAAGGGEPMDAECPDCKYVNEFTPHKDYLDFKKDKNGYCIDIFGHPLMSEHGPVAGHYGRRCLNELPTGPRGEFARCGYFWTSKMCPHCDEPNDIAARFCSSCKGELIDPNEKLIGDFKALKKDPYRVQTDEVVNMETKPGTSKAGNATIRVDWVTPYRQFSTWLMAEPKFPKQAEDLAKFNLATRDGTPETITYSKDRESGFFRVQAYDLPADVEPDPEKPEPAKPEAPKQKERAA